MLENTILKPLLLVFLAINIGCSQENNPSNPILTTIPNQTIPISFVALGDSYTIGQGVEVAERWPNQLQAVLQSQDYNVQKPIIIAKTGWTTKKLLDGIAAADLRILEKNIIVSLLIGVNNQYQNLAFEVFEKEFEQLLNKAIQIAGNKEHVFIVSIPDYGVTPFGSGNKDKIAKELDAYNAHMKQKSQELGVPFIDITPISRALGASENAVAKDQLHPSSFQYQKWVEKISPITIEILAKMERN